MEIRAEIFIESKQTFLYYFSINISIKIKQPWEDFVMIFINGKYSDGKKYLVFGKET